MPSLSNPDDRASILGRLERLAPDSARQWGKMTPHQAVCHLNDSFLMVMGLRPAQPAVTFINRTLVRFIALHTPLTWPKGVPTRPEADQHVGGTKPVDFGCDLRALRTSLARFTAASRDFTFAPHPMFGVLTEREWMVWGYRHMDHHLRQFGV